MDGDVLSGEWRAARPCGPRRGFTPAGKVSAGRRAVIGNADAESFSKELREGLRKAGSREGRNYVLEIRSAEEKLDRCPSSRRAGRREGRCDRRAVHALRLRRQDRDPRYSHRHPVGRSGRHQHRWQALATRRQPHRHIPDRRRIHSKCVEIFRDMLPSRKARFGFRQRGRPCSRNRSSWSGMAGRALASTSTRQRGQRAAEIEAAFRRDRQVGRRRVQGKLPPNEWRSLRRQTGCPRATSLRAFAETGGLMAYGSHGPVLFRQGPISCTRSCRARSPPTCRSSRPQSSSWWSTSRPRRAFGLNCSRAPARAPTR